MCVTTSCVHWEDSDRVISSHGNQNDQGYHDYHRSVDERRSVFSSASHQVLVLNTFDSPGILYYVGEKSRLTSSS